MNIAHCIHGLGLGGAQQIVKFIVRRSDHRAFRYHVYTCEDGVFRRDIEHAGATVRIIPRRLPKLDPFWAVALARAMHADAIDIVHTHLFGDSLHGYMAAQLAGPLPLVMTLHGGAGVQNALQRWGYPWLLQRATRTVACSESVRRSFAGIGARSIDIIPNAAEICAPDLAAADRRSFGLPANAVVIGGIGRLSEEKGFGDLIRAVRLLSRATAIDVRLLLVGEGPQDAALRAQARAEGVESRVVFTGFRSDVQRILPLLDVVAFSCISDEGLPIALLEAMAAARCIVATDAGGIMDALTPGRDALVVPRSDPRRLAAALARAAADPTLRRRLGAAAQQRFLREFTTEQMVRRYERVYCELYDGRHPDAPCEVPLASKEAKVGRSARRLRTSLSPTTCADAELHT